MGNKIPVTWFAPVLGVVQRGMTAGIHSRNDVSAVESVIFWSTVRIDLRQTNLNSFASKMFSFMREFSSFLKIFRA